MDTSLDRFAQGICDMQDQIPKPDEDDEESYVGWDIRWLDD
jgi:hypothetical protein